MTATPSWYLSISITLIVLSGIVRFVSTARSEEHTSELQSQSNLVCRLLLEKKKAQRHRLSVGDVRGMTEPDPDSMWARTGWHDVPGLADITAAVLHVSVVDMAVTAASPLSA